MVVTVWSVFFVVLFELGWVDATTTVAVDLANAFYFSLIFQAPAKAFSARTLSQPTT